MILDLHEELQNNTYQASSIHSRRRFSSVKAPNPSDNEHLMPPSVALQSTQHETRWNNRLAQKERRLLSDLWLMYAATFRRQGKIEQAKGAIQEAEVKDEGNPAVWVQVRHLLVTSI